MELQKWTINSDGNPSEAYKKMLGIISDIILSDSNIMLNQQSAKLTAGRIIATIAHEHGFVFNNGTSVEENWTLANGKLNSSEKMNQLCQMTEEILWNHHKGFYNKQEWVRPVARELAAEEIIEVLASHGIQPPNNF